jgi:hypothetical protein
MTCSKAASPNSTISAMPTDSTLSTCSLTVWPRWIATSTRSALAPSLSPRETRRIVQRRQAGEIVQRSLNELIATLGDTRRRGNHKARAQHINRDISVGPNPAALIVMPIPRLVITAAAANDDWRLAVAIDRISQHLLIFGVDIEHGDAAAAATHKANRWRVGKLPRQLTAAVAANALIAADRWHFVIAHRKRRDATLGISRLPV